MVKSALKNAVIFLLFALIVPATGSIYNANNEFFPETDFAGVVDKVNVCEHDGCVKFHSHEVIITQEVIYYDSVELANILASVEPILLSDGIHSFSSEDIVLFGEPLAPELLTLLEPLDFVNPIGAHCAGFTMTFLDHTIGWSDLNDTSHSFVRNTRWRCNGCFAVIPMYASGPAEAHTWLITSHWHGAGNTHHANQRCQQCSRTRTTTWICPPHACIMPWSLLVEQYE